MANRLFAQDTPAATQAPPGGAALPQPRNAGQPTPEGPTGGVPLEEAKETLLKQATIAQKLGELVADDGKATRKEVIRVATDIIGERIMSAQQMAGLLKDLPKDPVQVAEWVKKKEADARGNFEKLLGMIHGMEAPPQGMPPEMAGMPPGAPDAGAAPAMPQPTGMNPTQ